MVYLIGASCLRNAIQAIPYRARKNFPIGYTAIGGLSLNPYTRQRTKNLQFLLNQRPLNQKSGIILWHGVISNSISKHESNGGTELNVDDLCEYLRTKKERFAAIVYLQRFLAPNIFEKLKDTGILILDVKKRLISRKKQKCHFIQAELGKVHPLVSLELNILSTVINHLKGLRLLTRKRRSKRVHKTPARLQKEKDRKRRQKLKKKKEQSFCSLSICS